MGPTGKINWKWILEERCDNVDSDDMVLNHNSRKFCEFKDHPLPWN
jgi:hypothetical protein